MNICTPGNCICDAREWEGDTDCFGNTEEDDRNMNGRQAIELLREWDLRNQARGWTEDITLGEFLESKGFPVEGRNGRFLGRDLDEPNFRSRFVSTEIPVGNSGQEKPVSIGERRRRGDLRANRGVHYRESTDEVLRNRAQKAAGGPVENEQGAWEVEAMEYFKDRVDGIENSVRKGQSYIEDEIQRVHARIDALVELVSKVLDERSESRVAVEPKVVVTLDNVPADVAEELQAELTKRVERIMARRVQHSDSC